MKYIYIVTRTITDSTAPGTPIPNLGVHSSLGRATTHYESVLEYRKKSGSKIHWDRNCLADEKLLKMSGDRGVARVRESYIENKYDRENLFIERWPLK